MNPFAKIPAAAPRADKTENSLYAPLCASLTLAQIEDAASLRATFEQIARRRFGTVVLPLRVADEVSWAKTRAALQACAEFGLKAILRVQTADIEYSNSTKSTNGAPYLSYQTRDVSVGHALHDDECLARTVVPRLANSDLSWARAQTQTRFETDEKPLDFEARLYLWHQRTDATRLYDALDANAVEAVISSTRKAWKQVVTRELRALVDGVSVEVPRLWDETAPDATRRFPWTSGFAARFHSLHGYEITENLSSLVADTGENAVRVRQDFWQTIAILLQESFVASWENWARAENVALQWRLRAAPLNRVVGFYGAVAPLLTNAHDVVVETERDAEIFGDAKNSSNTVFVRFLASLAATNAPQKTSLTVAFPHEVLSDNSPPLFEWHRFLLAGASGFEIAWREDRSGARAEVLHRYIARQIALLHGVERDGERGSERGSENVARVGVLWPLRSGWAHHHPKGHRFVRWVEEDLCDVADWLDDLHFSWIFAEENAICKATIEDRVLDAAQNARATTLLQCGQNALEVVVLPSVTCLSRATWTKLQEFASRGGKIICLGLLPRWSEIGRDEKQEKQLEAQTRSTLEDVYEAYRREGREKNEQEMLAPSSVGYPILRQTASGGRISTYQPRLNLDRDDARLRVRPIFTESLAPELETQSRHLRIARRQTPDGDAFWLWNTRAETAKINAILHAGNIAQIDEHDLWNESPDATGAPVPLWMPLTSAEGGGAALTFEMAPNEARLLMLRDLTLRDARQNVQPHGESANFVVESFDGAIARGHMKQSGAPMIAVRQNGKLLWSNSAPIVVPSPVLLDDWEENARDGEIEYSISVQIPRSWRDCVVRLEVASVTQSENVVAAFANDQFLGRRFAPLLCFGLMLQGENENEPFDLALRLRVEKQRDNEEALLARLVAYPRVEIVVTPNGELHE